MNIELSDEQKVKIRTDWDLYPIMREILLQANKTDLGKEHYSFERDGLMAKLYRSKKFVPGFVQVEQLKKEAQRIGEEIGRREGAKEKAVEIAKQLKQEGVVLDIIMKSTGLSRKEAEELFLRD